MSELADIVREIRKAAGITQGSLARFLGVDQTAVSQWERQQTAPSTDILLVLHSLANTENQIRIRRVLLDRLENISGAELDSLLTNLQRHDHAVGHEHLVGTVLDGVVQRRKGIRPLVEEARKLVESGLTIHPAIPQMMRLYREYAQLPGVRNLFWRALGYVDMELQKRSAKATAPRARHKPAAGPGRSNPKDSHPQPAV